jgi:hypothetical protein
MNIRARTGIERRVQTTIGIQSGYATSGCSTVRKEPTPYEDLPVVLHGYGKHMVAQAGTHIEFGIQTPVRVQAR